jgi:chromosome segregation ATPase
MEDFAADLSALKIKRAAFEEQLSKGDGDARSLQNQLREVDGQIAVIEDAIKNGNASRSSSRPPRSLD